MTRIRRVESVRKQEQLIDEFITRGYKVKQQGQYSAKVKEKDWGSLPVHGFIFLFVFIAAAVVFDAAGVSTSGVWVSAILANVAYAAYSRVTGEEVVIKVEDEGS